MLSNKLVHRMELIKEHEGTEEWLCPECGRRLLIEWNPFKRVVVEVGDENASHSGSKGDLEIGDISVE